MTVTAQGRRIDRVASGALVAIVVGGCLIPVSMALYERGALSRTLVGLSGATVATGAVLLVVDRQPHAAMAVAPLAVAPAAIIATSTDPGAPFPVLLITFPLAVGAAAYATVATRRLKIDPIAAAALAVIEVSIGYQFQGAFAASPFGQARNEQGAAEGRTMVYLSGLAIAAAAAMLLADRKPGPAIAVVPLAVVPAAQVAARYHAKIEFGNLGAPIYWVSIPMAVGAGIYAIFSRRRRRRRP